MKTSNIANFYNKGQELIKKNRLDDALNIFLELSKKDKKSSNILLTIAQIYTQKNNLIKSKIYLKKAIKINPDYFIAYSNLGSVFYQLGEFKKARECYEKAIQINPNFANAHFGLGSLYEELNETMDETYPIREDVPSELWGKRVENKEEKMSDRLGEDVYEDLLPKGWEQPVAAEYVRDPVGYGGSDVEIFGVYSPVSTA